MLQGSSSFSAELPFSNTFNTHCDICSHPILPSDINVLQPCFCGPFHGYCISNLELQTRENRPTSPNPQLRCPRCRQLVTAVAYDFVYDMPRATRKPFTHANLTQSNPAHLAHPHILPIAIHDTSPVTPNLPTPPRKWSCYPKPTMPDLPQSWPSLPHLPKTTSSSMPRPLYERAQTDFTPSAPPAPYDDESLPSDLNDCFPPPAQEFKPQSSHRKQGLRQTAPSFQRRQASNFAAESRTSRLQRVLDVPSPQRHERRSQSQVESNQSRKDSPKTVAICRQVSEEDVRKGLYGDDVYKAYVEGKAAVLGPGEASKSRKGHGKEVNVKVEMDLHVYHHYKPWCRPTDQLQDRKGVREKDRRRTKTAEKTWWKSPRSGSRLDSRDRQYYEECYRGRGAERR